MRCLAMVVMRFLPSQASRPTLRVWFVLTKPLSFHLHCSSRCVSSLDVIYLDLLAASGSSS